MNKMNVAGKTGSLSVLAGLAASSALAMNSEVQYQMVESGGNTDKTILASRAGGASAASIDALISFYSKHKFEVSADELKAIEDQFGALPTDAEIQSWINSPKTTLKASAVTEGDGEGFMSFSSGDKTILGAE